MGAAESCEGRSCGEVVQCEGRDLEAAQDTEEARSSRIQQWIRQSFSQLHNNRHPERVSIEQFIVAAHVLEEMLLGHGDWEAQCFSRMNFDQADPHVIARARSVCGGTYGQLGWEEWSRKMQRLVSERDASELYWVVRVGEVLLPHRLRIRHTLQVRTPMYV